MHHFILALSLLLFPTITGSAHAPADAQTHDAMVVLAVPGLTDAAVSGLSRELGRQRNMGIDYSCTWSGVLVIKLDGINVSEPADVITMVRRHLAAAGIETGAEVLRVHVESRGVGKC